MEQDLVESAIAAATSVAGEQGLSVEDAVVLQNSNKLALRLLPCDVFARIARPENDNSEVELALARSLMGTDTPIAALEPRVDAIPYPSGQFVVTLWKYHEPATTNVAPDAFASALQRLHTGMRDVNIDTPHFTDRVDEALVIVDDRALSPGLADPDRGLLATTLAESRASIIDRDAPEQLLHGEPHPGNVVGAATGPVFVDLETCCRGPVEFDLAHVPRAVADRYADVDLPLLDECRRLVISMVASWRFDVDDEFPDGLASGRRLIDALRLGPPWPTIEEISD